MGSQPSFIIISGQYEVNSVFDSEWFLCTSQNHNILCYPYKEERIARKYFDSWFWTNKILFNKGSEIACHSNNNFKDNIRASFLKWYQQKIQGKLNSLAQEMKILYSKLYQKSESEIKFQKQIDELREENKKILQKINDPEDYCKLKEKQFQQFLNLLGSKKWTEDLPNNFGLKNHVVVGDISVGKSSLLNYFFGLNLEIGIDETTLFASPVRKGKVTIWDSPGFNQDFDLADVRILKLFASADKIFILFNTSLKSCQNSVRILNTINGNKLTCIRTKCDQFKDDLHLQSTLVKDRELLKKWGMNRPVYGVSSIKNGFHNHLVKEMMDKE